MRDIAVMARRSSSNALLPASLTTWDVQAQAARSGFTPRSWTFVAHRCITPITPDTTSPCPPHRRMEDALELRKNATPSDISSTAPFWRMVTPSLLIKHFLESYFAASVFTNIDDSEVGVNSAGLFFSFITSFHRRVNSIWFGVRMMLFALHMTARPSSYCSMREGSCVTAHNPSPSITRGIFLSIA